MNEQEQPSVGDVVEVPWELDRLQGVVHAVDERLQRLLVQVVVKGSAELLSFPATAVTLVSHEDLEQPAETEGNHEPWAGGIDDNTVLKSVLDAVGPGRPVSVHLRPTTDDDGTEMLHVDVFLLSDDDRDLPADELLDLQTRVRESVFSAIEERAIVLSRVIPLEQAAQ